MGWKDLSVRDRPTNHMSWVLFQLFLRLLQLDLSVPLKKLRKEGHNFKRWLILQKWAKPIQMSSESHNYFLNQNMHLETQFLSFQLLKTVFQWQSQSIIIYPKILIPWEYTYICQTLGSELEHGSSDTLQCSDLNYTPLSPLDHSKQLSPGETCSSRESPPHSRHDSVSDTWPGTYPILLRRTDNVAVSACACCTPDNQNTEGTQRFSQPPWQPPV